MLSGLMSGLMPSLDEIILYPGSHLSRGLAQAPVSSRERSVSRTCSGLSKS